jgi:hypothetical protein
MKLAPPGRQVDWHHNNTNSQIFISPIFLELEVYE